MIVLRLLPFIIIIFLLFFSPLLMTPAGYFFFQHPAGRTPGNAAAAKAVSDSLARIADQDYQLKIAHELARYISPNISLKGIEQPLLPSNHSLSDPSASGPAMAVQSPRREPLTSPYGVHGNNYSLYDINNPAGHLGKL